MLGPLLQLGDDPGLAVSESTLGQPEPLGSLEPQMFHLKVTEGVQG